MTKEELIHQGFYFLKDLYLFIINWRSKVDVVWAEKLRHNMVLHTIWPWAEHMNLGRLTQMGFNNTSNQEINAEPEKIQHKWKGKKLEPCVREVSDARRPSRKLTDEWLCALRSSEIKLCGLALEGCKQGKVGSAWLAGGDVSIPPPWGGGSSARLRSLFVEPKSYSESMLPRDGFKAMERSFPIEIIHIIFFYYNTIPVSVLLISQTIHL